MKKWYNFDFQTNSCKNSHIELAYILEAFEHIVLDVNLEKQMNKQSHIQTGSTTAPPKAAS